MKLRKFPIYFKFLKCKNKDQLQFGTFLVSETINRVAWRCALTSICNPYIHILTGIETNSKAMFG